MAKQSPSEEVRVSRRMSQLAVEDGRAADAAPMGGELRKRRSSTSDLRPSLLSRLDDYRTACIGGIARGDDGLAGGVVRYIALHVFAMANPHFSSESFSPTQQGVSAFVEWVFLLILVGSPLLKLYTALGRAYKPSQISSWDEISSKRLRGITAAAMWVALVVSAGQMRFSILPAGYIIKSFNPDPPWVPSSRVVHECRKHVTETHCSEMPYCVWTAEDECVADRLTWALDYHRSGDELFLLGSPPSMEKKVTFDFADYALTTSVWVVIGIALILFDTQFVCVVLSLSTLLTVTSYILTFLSLSEKKLFSVFLSQKPLTSIGWLQSLRRLAHVFYLGTGFHLTLYAGEVKLSQSVKCDGNAVKPSMSLGDAGLILPFLSTTLYLLQALLLNGCATLMADTVGLDPADIHFGWDASGVAIASALSIQKSQQFIVCMYFSAIATNICAAAALSIQSVAQTLMISRRFSGVREWKVYLAVLAVVSSLTGVFFITPSHDLLTTGAYGLYKDITSDLSWSVVLWEILAIGWIFQFEKSCEKLGKLVPSVFAAVYWLNLIIVLAIFTKSTITTSLLTPVCTAQSETAKPVITPEDGNPCQISGVCHGVYLIALLIVPNIVVLGILSLCRWKSLKRTVPLEVANDTGHVHQLNADFPPSRHQAEQLPTIITLDVSLLRQETDPRHLPYPTPRQPLKLPTRWYPDPSTGLCEEHFEIHRRRQLELQQQQQLPSRYGKCLSVPEKAAALPRIGSHNAAVEPFGASSPMPSSVSIMLPPDTLARIAWCISLGIVEDMWRELHRRTIPEWAEPNMFNLGNFWSFNVRYTLPVAAVFVQLASNTLLATCSSINNQLRFFAYTGWVFYGITHMFVLAGIFFPSIYEFLLPPETVATISPRDKLSQLAPAHFNSVPASNVLMVHGGFSTGSRNLAHSHTVLPPRDNKQPNSRKTPLWMQAFFGEMLPWGDKMPAEWHSRCSPR